MTPKNFKKRQQRVTAANVCLKLKILRIKNRWASGVVITMTLARHAQLSYLNHQDLIRLKRKSVVHDFSTLSFFGCSPPKPLFSPRASVLIKKQKQRFCENVKRLCLQMSAKLVYYLQCHHQFPFLVDSGLPVGNLILVTEVPYRCTAKLFLLTMF